LIRSFQRLNAFLVANVPYLEGEVIAAADNPVLAFHEPQELDLVSVGVDMEIVNFGVFLEVVDVDFVFGGYC
jgi:hypothetical protein